MSHQPPPPPEGMPPLPEPPAERTPSWGCIIVMVIVGIIVMIFGVCVVAFLQGV